MTEKDDAAYDLYVRQNLLSANRVPVFLGGMPNVLKNLHETIDAEVANCGTGVQGIPQVTSAPEAEKQIWAARCINYAPELKDYCRGIEYNGTCWIDRDDYTPTHAQNAEPEGRAGWHPGFRYHALKGRIIGMMVLRALHKGFTMWEEAPNKKLAEEIWHVTDHYENIRNKLKEQKVEESFCFKGNAAVDPKDIICAYPLNGVSEMTPRNFPLKTAVRNLMKPASDGYLPEPEESVYNPPDVFNPTLETPEGEFDYLAVVENGIDYNAFISFDNAPVTQGSNPTGNKLIPLGVDGIEPGRGWACDCNTNPAGCDGSYDGFCGRGHKVDCLLSGHNDHRGGLWFDSFSGWGVFTVPNVRKGLIFARIEWWYGNVNPITDGWKSENNATSRYLREDFRQRNIAHSYHEPAPDADDYKWIENANSNHRDLKGAELCANFKFEFVVNGKLTAYDKGQYMEHNQGKKELLWRGKCVAPFLSHHSFHYLCSLSTSGPGHYTLKR